MVRGLDTFREYFKGFENQYVLIGGAACDILFASNEGQFRATRDLRKDRCSAGDSTYGSEKFHQEA